MRSRLLPQSPATHSSDGLRPPKQDRSRETLERILGATEELLGAKEFADISIGEIVEQAGSSVGAFYKRFENKEALLPHLMERILRNQNRAIHEHILDRDWTGKGLRERLGTLLTTSLMAGRQNGGLLRAIVVRQFLDPHSMSDRECEESERQFGLLVEWLGQCAEEIRHPNSELAVRMSLMMTVFAIHQRVLSPTSPRFDRVDVNDERFASELADAAWAYLTIEQGNRGVAIDPSTQGGRSNARST